MAVDTQRTMMDSNSTVWLPMPRRTFIRRLMDTVAVTITAVATMVALDGIDENANIVDGKDELLFASTSTLKQTRRRRRRKAPPLLVHPRFDPSIGVIYKSFASVLSRGKARVQGL